MQKNAQTGVTVQKCLDTMSRGDEKIPVLVERVTYHNENKLTVRKWCLKSGMIVDVIFRDLPVPEFALVVK